MNSFKGLGRTPGHEYGYNLTSVKISGFFISQIRKRHPYKSGE